MKKTARKVLLMACSALLLVCLTVGATVAYLTSTTGVVTNTFTVGNVTITLDETDVDDSTPDKDRDTANGYKLMPGTSYVKDPIVHVDSTSEEAWLFVKVTNEITGIEGATTVANQMTAKGWTLVSGQTDIYAYANKVKANDNITVFESFKVKDDVDNATLATYANKTITVQAYAVQAENFDTAAAAYAAAPCAAWAAPATPDAAE